MRLIAVDLELNQPSHKMIQIGAVCFQPDKGLLVETFNQLIDPKEELSEEISALTGIKKESLLGKPDAVAAAELFTQFKKRHQANSIGIVWGGALSNDIRHIYQETGLESPFDSRIIDVKAVFQMLANATTSEMRQKAGLEKACLKVGIGWDDKFGAPHDALADAYNTYRIYMFLSKCLVGGFNLKRSFD